MNKIKIFIAYSREDKKIKNELLTALESIKLTGYVDTWDDSQIMIGDKWEDVLKKNLLTSDIYLFLVSSNSIASKYVREVELKHAIERANKGEAYLVPIIIKPCLWKELEISAYQVLPENGHPITDSDKWSDVNKAYLNITEQLLELINQIRKRRYQGEDFADNDFAGSIEMITGCMFSGKTVDLILRMKDAIFKGQSVILFKHKKDNRYSEKFVVSHNKDQMEAIPVKSANDILKIVKTNKPEVIGIDEVHFFDDDLAHACNRLANQGKKIFLAGLDKDYNGFPFETVKAIMPFADKVTKKLARCQECNNDATFSYRKINKTRRELIGGFDEYEPLCRKCYGLKMKSKKNR